MDAPPQCPPGYDEVRENSKCGLYCRDIVGYTWRCPCNDWMSCAVKERYLWGCADGYYSSFRVRECAQVVRSGRCPAGGSPGSQQSCNSDTDCPSDEKCCNSMCATIITIDTHSCRKNNGGCDQLCFGVPGGRKCGCENGIDYDETLSKCLTDTTPTSTPPLPATTPPLPATTPPLPTTTPPIPTTPPSCTPHPAPEHGSVTCDADPVPQFGKCRFTCDQGYELKGNALDICVNGEWIDDTPTCNTRTKPTFSHCPNDTSVPTDPGKSYGTVNWNVPTAADKDGVNLNVDIFPSGYDPPVKVNIGRHNVRLSTSDKHGVHAYCYFHIIVEDREPPTFGSSCPNDVTLYTDNEDSVRLPSSVKKPVAIDNAKPPNLYIKSYTHDSYFPIGTTMVNYTAVDAAGLSASCIFCVTVVNVCRGVTCTHGAKCALDNTTGNSYTCACNSICPQDYDPVCGSDSQTYNNECLMNVTRCLSRRNIAAVSKGTCEGVCSTVQCDHGATCKVIGGVAKCACDFTCTDSKSLVCGSDLQTYDNECKMREAGCKAKRNIIVLVNGKCGDCSTVQCAYGATCKVIAGVAKCECDFTCADSKSLVCGSDLQTYDNECKMREAGCKAKRNIIVLVNGKCGDCSTVQCGYGATCKVIGGVAKCECDFTCTDSKSLVCGSDLQTYDNECKMREAGCKAKRSIIVLVNGKCGNCSTVQCGYGATCKVIAGVAKCECDFTCTDSKSLVCGSDLQTYDNECKMREAGCKAKRKIIVLVNGKCGDCSTVQCTYGATCKVIAGVAKCECDFTCTDSISLVCGSDLQTYDNECKMREAGCTTKKNITILVNGKCGDCSTVQCGYGATCKVIGGVAKCECDFTCTDSKSLVCGSDLQTYDNECKMREAGCKAKRSIIVLVNGNCETKGDCSRLNCKYGATCQVIKDLAQCECNFTCLDSRSPVCGSDGRTYKNICDLQKKQCTEKKYINVIKNEACGCDDLNLSSEDFKNTSEMACQNIANSVKCEVRCQVGYNAVFPNFLKLQCYDNKWIRKNNIEKYVRLPNENAPPRCYKPTPKSVSAPYCRSGSVLMDRDICVPCPPGSYYNKDGAVCAPCAVTMYQGESGKTDCKKCLSPKTSTITGAEGCYFDHSSNDVKMVFEKKRSEVLVLPLVWMIVLP
ncbi:agrin-like isoform X1 [Paramuricea clavata]|uniref:Agrin-like isoform X1 n=1 Tax=Paramuricea clavata TaxID=317549 RepID=A0A7D9DBA9_PARCT|nr:agrin-like isoform X1 [Paramuricea clavata]